MSDEFADVCDLLSVRFDAQDRRGSSLRLLARTRTIGAYGDLDAKSDAEVEQLALRDGMQLVWERAARFLLLQGD